MFSLRTLFIIERYRATASTFLSKLFPMDLFIFWRVSDLTRRNYFSFADFYYAQLLLLFVIMTVALAPDQAVFNNTVNSLINEHANQRTALINGRIHFPRRIDGKTLIDQALKSGQAISGLSFQRTHFYSRNEDFPLFFSLISGQGKKKKNYQHSFDFLF